MPGMPHLTMNHSLTGRTRMRVGQEATGVLARQPIIVMQVEEKYLSYPPLGPLEGRWLTRWRDMRVSDMGAPVATEPAPPADS